MSTYIEILQKGNITEVVLSRPEAYNAFNLEMITELAQHLTQLATDGSVRGITISGNGKAFCAGGDIKWVLEYADKAGSSFHALASQLHLAIVEIRRMTKPVVAAINGTAAGAGFSLALACDFRIMEQSAVLRQAYTSNGLCIDGGGTFTLPRIVGLARAMEIAAFDDPIPSAQALEWGLATRVVDDGTVLEEAKSMLNTLLKKSTYSLKNCLPTPSITPLSHTWKWKERGFPTVQIILTARRALRPLSKSANQFLATKKAAKIH